DAIFVVEHEAPAALVGARPPTNGVKVNYGPLHNDLPRRALRWITRAADGQSDAGFGRTVEHPIDRIIEGDLVGRPAIDMGNDVPRQNAGCYGRRVGGAAEDLQTLIDRADVHPDAAEYSVCAVLEPDILLLIEIKGVRIFQTIDHRLDAGIDG